MNYKMTREELVEFLPRWIAHLRTNPPKSYQTYIGDNHNCACAIGWGALLYANLDITTTSNWEIIFRGSQAWAFINGKDIQDHYCKIIDLSDDSDSWEPVITYLEELYDNLHKAE